jgi:PAS domain S-box-containing protein
MTLLPNQESIDAAESAARSSNGYHHLITKEELQLLRDRLREAQETLEAIQSGEVDAVVVTGKAGSQIYTLTSAEEPYRVFVEQMQEGAVTVSLSGMILYCNRKFAEFLGLELERVISSSADDHLGFGVWQGIVEGLNHRAMVKKEAILRRAPDAALPVMVTASLLDMVDQKVVCLVVTDLSEQKEMSELTIAKEVAEAANHSKDSFLAALSHELRTPLTPALMGACLLERDNDLSEKSRYLVTMIRRNVELETRLIDDLLDLTRVTQGKIELRTKEIDLHIVLQEAVDICRADVDDRGQRIHLSLEAKHSHVMGDPVRLQQIFWNLIRNASKFSGRHQAISIRSRSFDDGRIEVSVSDEGVGIEAGLIPKLFSPFEQGGDEVTRRYGGLGLGLVISKSIAELHDGGSIHAHSSGKDQGSTFTLVLRTLPKDEAPQHVNGTAPSRGRILLVEDNPDTRLTLSMLLQSLDYQVQAGESVKRGLEIAGRSEFDLLISDIGLPDGTGYDLMREVGKLYGLRGIAVSGYGMPEDIQRSVDAGFAVHLIKPIMAADLEAAMEKVRSGAGE